MHSTTNQSQEAGAHQIADAIRLRESPDNPFPPGGNAVRVTAEDGIGVRVSIWPLPRAQGTVLLFPGRTEFAEMHYETVTFLREAGWASASVDWRGQGASDRLLPERRKGHIDRFANYQHDARCLMEVCRMSEMPEPWIILANSMGAAICLRWMVENPSSAMGAILLGSMLKLNLRWLGNRIATPVSQLLCHMGQRGNYAAGCDCRTVTERGFRRNPLTSSRTRFARLEGVEKASPERVIGGVTWGWLQEALKETRWLEQAKLPFFPKLLLIGDRDGVVDLSAVRRLAINNPQTRHVVLRDCRHAILLEHDAAVAKAREEIVRFLELRANG